MTPNDEKFEFDDIKQKLQQNHDFSTDQIALLSNILTLWTNRAMQYRVLF